MNEMNGDVTQSYWGSQMCGFHKENCPRIDGDTTAMQRGRFQKLITVKLFSSRRGQRGHDEPSGISLYDWFPYHRKRSSSIADHRRGHVPVAYDDMETTL